MYKRQPIGVSGYDAFGCKPTFLDKGIRKRAILSVGRQDVRIEALTPVLDGKMCIRDRSRPTFLGNYFSYIAGMNNMDIYKFLLYTFLGIFPWTLFMLSLIHI